MSKQNGASDEVVEVVESVGETRSPNGWRDELYPTLKGRPHHEAWKHGAAEALHQWLGHAHHQNGAIQLSRADYEAALQAATQTNDGAYVPHAAAMGRLAGRA